MYQSAPPQPGLAGGAYGMAMGQSQTSGKAIGSLVCGIVGLIIPLIGGVVAIVLGHLGLSEIKRSAGRLKGDGLAIAGLFMGYLRLLKSGQTERLVQVALTKLTLLYQRAERVDTALRAVCRVFRDKLPKPVLAGTQIPSPRRLASGTSLWIKQESSGLAKRDRRTKIAKPCDENGNKKRELR